MASEGIRRIAVAGGGTGGHILPALDLLEAYRREFYAEGCFLGCAGGLESRLAAAAGERFYAVPGLPWARQSWPGKGKAAAILPRAVHAARGILARERIELVIGTGGYASFSACAAAYTLGIPVAIHEANAEPGMANRLLGRIASVICVGTRETARHFRRAARVTGIPAGQTAYARPPLGPPWRFLVSGGSEGSPLLNREAPLLFAELRRRGIEFSVRHLAGFGERTPIERAYAGAGVEGRVEGFVDAMAPLYTEAHLALASAGARTLAEMSAAGLPSFIVPLPGAAYDHQVANARLYAVQAGAATIFEDRWDVSAIASSIQQILADPEELHRRERSARQWWNPHAALDMVRACEGFLTETTAAMAGSGVGDYSAGL